jgi:hypothetical protein
MPLKNIMQGPTHQQYFLKLMFFFIFRNNILKNQHKQNNSKKTYIKK